MKPQVLSEFYKSLFERMVDGLAYCQMIFDKQGNPVDFVYLMVNKNFEKLTGLRDAVGKKVTELIPGIKTSNPELFEIYGRVALTGKPERFETYVEPLAKWFSISVYSSQRNFFVAVFQNITDRKQIEEDLINAKTAARNVLEDLQVEKETLANAKAKDEAMLASIGDGIIVTDPDKKIIIMNKMAKKLLGWENNEAIGKLYDDVVLFEDEKGSFVPPAQKPLHKAFEKFTTTTTTTTSGLYLLSKNKIKFPVAITVSPVILDNKIIGAVEVFRDTTKEKEIDKLKDEFLSIASHELRTPLTAIDGLVSMILEGDYGTVNKELMQPLSDVNTSSERLIHLVNDLLNLSRLQSGRLKYTFSETDIKPIVEGIVKMMQIIAEPKGLKLSAPNINSVTVSADIGKVEEILDNLIGNSLKFTDKGSIILSTKLSEDKVIIFITDTGIGIRKEDLGKLFGRFEKLESGLGRLAGTGLGLHISRELVRKMGGDVWLEKSEAGVGSTFAFSLPIAKSPLAEKIKKRNCPPAIA